MTAVLHAFGSIKVHISLLTDLPYGKASMPYAVPAKRVEEPEQVADPKRYDNHDHGIQYRLDGRLHGDEAVHNPEQHAHGDECKDNIDEWQGMLLSSDEGAWALRVSHPQDLAAWLIQPGLVYFASATALV
jgi:hypothetical protein